MPQGTINSYMANGNILPYSFVKFDSSAPYKVIQASANTDQLLGIAIEAAKDTPLPALTGTQYAAIAGTQLRVYQVGTNCLILVGTGGVTAGDLLTSSSTGAALTSAPGSGNIVCAIARDTRAAGELCPVEVIVPRIA